MSINLVSPRMSLLHKSYLNTLHVYNCTNFITNNMYQTKSGRSDKYSYIYQKKAIYTKKHLIIKKQMY